jgi:hypothetical protein
MQESKTQFGPIEYRLQQHARIQQHGLKPFARRIVSNRHTKLKGPVLNYKRFLEFENMT